MSLSTRFNTVFSGVDEVRIINLKERKDRREEIVEQLNRLGIDVSIEDDIFFPAHRPTELGDWPSLGARGCFISHFEIIRQALASGAEVLLVLEDDCDFSPDGKVRIPQALGELRQMEWDFAYLGHVLEAPLNTAQTASWFHTQEPIPMSHCYLIHKRAMPRFIDFLEKVASRPGGHPDGGPQHYDGALNTYFYQNPDVRVWLCNPSLAHQRSSKSDISTGRMDQIPLLRDVWAGLRKVKRKLGR